MRHIANVAWRKYLIAIIIRFQQVVENPQTYKNQQPLLISFSANMLNNFVFRLGYQECMSETMRFMVEVEGHFPRDAICVRLLSHLTKHCELISRAPHIPQQTPSPTHVPVHHPQELTRNVSVPQDYQVPKQESESPEQNNNNGCVTNSCNNSESEHEKHHETNGALYKYKTNIKLRFNQDLNGGQEVPTKKPKLESSRRNSVTSLENHR